jgi:peptide/nickel transport system substrate-binding protein
MDKPLGSAVNRRDLLKLGGIAAAAGAVGAGGRLIDPGRAEAQTPKRGGVFRICAFTDPSGFDPHLTVNWWTMINLSFTHSRLLKHKAGPGVQPGTFPVEGDLAESWTQPNDTAYVFKLRRGVRWHNKPPVNGRELSAEDVKYSYERFFTIKGNPNRTTLEQIERIDALDRYTVQFTLKEPFCWFLDALAATTTWIVPKEAVDQYGDLKRPEACIGTGPWMLERYEPNVRSTFVRNPSYFVSALPYADGVELAVDPDPSSSLASWLAGRYDFAPSYGMVVRRVDLDAAKRRKPGLQTSEFTWMITGVTAMKLDQEPFRDIRVRRAMSMANNWKETLEVLGLFDGHGGPSPSVPAALREWAIPIDQLAPEGRRLYDHNIPQAKRLLAEAGYPSGFKTPIETTTGFGSDFMDAVQVSLKNWKAAGVEADLKLKEMGAFISSTIFGKFEKMMTTIRGGALFPDTYLAAFHLPGQALNSAGVNDPKLNEMIRLQRRTFDVAKRREVLYDIQRYLAEQAYYLYGPSGKVVSAWEPYVKGFAPNLGNDYGGRLMAAWLDK